MTDSKDSDQRSQRERMLAGDLYLASDADLTRESRRAGEMVQQYNGAPHADDASRSAILRQLLGAVGDDSVLRPPFYCDYGYQIHIGSRVFANFGLVALDVARITIGDDVQIGPNVQLLTSTHPLDPAHRRDKWEAAKPITLGNNVWLGGGVIVCPSVTIGDNTVIGAVVTRDVPSNVVAVGNPARVIRSV